jgi:hypothetical protein
MKYAIWRHIAAKQRVRNCFSILVGYGDRYVK